jgi:hypothetical protein
MDKWVNYEETPCKSMDELIELACSFGLIKENEKPLYKLHANKLFEADCYSNPTDLDIDEHKITVPLTIKAFRGIKKQIDKTISKYKHIEKQDLPPELDTPKARLLLDKAIKAGFINEIPNGYKWNYSKALCAYFADKATIYLNISKAVTDTGKVAAWKPFETVFKLNGLKTCKADWRKGKDFPKGYKDVDTLFD